MVREYTLEEAPYNFLPDGEEYLEYLEDLIKKGTPSSDVTLIVDWVPHVKELLRRIEVLEEEYSLLSLDYEKMKTERLKNLRSGTSSTPSGTSEESSTSSTGFPQYGSPRRSGTSRGE